MKKPVQVTEFERDGRSVLEHLVLHLDNTPLGLIEWNTKLQATAWSLRAEAIFGWTRTELEEWNMTVHSLVHPDDLPWVKLLVQQLMTGVDEKNHIQCRVNTRQGEIRWCRWYNSVSTKKGGKALTIVSFVQDITELIAHRQTLEEQVLDRTRELKNALIKEKERVEVKSKFISIASHEFRTPLSTISLIAGILRKHTEKMSAHEFNAKLDTLEKQVSHMTSLLDDIVIMGKVDAETIKLQYDRVRIKDFFEQTASAVEQSTNTHKIKVRITCLEEMIRSDEKLLRNIVVNLLTNAVKFSPKGKLVSLNVACQHDVLTLEVKDSGIGIAKEELNQVFTSFYRGSNAGTIQGTGLGLSIVKKAVTLLTGNIRIQSRRGRGTIVTVTLPM